MDYLRCNISSENKTDSTLAESMPFLLPSKHIGIDYQYIIEGNKELEVAQGWTVMGVCDPADYKPFFPDMQEWRWIVEVYCA